MTANRWATRLRPHKIPFRRSLTRASVALIYRRSEGGTELLFIQRARRDGDPWSGDMAFPGGRMEPGDATPRATAERETLEETGVDLTRHGRFQARLSDLITRHHSRWRPMVVTPYVYEWQGTKPVTLNHEVERVVWVPLDYLAAQENQGILGSGGNEKGQTTDNNNTDTAEQLLGRMGGLRIKVTLVQVPGQHTAGC